jgi:hypothetical protein
VLVWLKTELALVTEVPVLVAIDNFNCLFEPSEYYDMDSKSYKPQRLMPKQLLVPQLFCDHRNQFMLNGTTAVAWTREGGSPARNITTDESDHVINVEPYSLPEFQSIMAEYAKAGVMSAGQNRFGVKYLHALTGANPAEIAKFAHFL